MPANRVSQETLIRISSADVGQGGPETGEVELSGLALGEFEQDGLEAGDVPAFPVPADDHRFAGIPP